jgi:hypothetical protein
MPLQGYDTHDCHTHGYVSLRHVLLRFGAFRER